MKISTRVEIGSHDINAVVFVSQFLAEYIENGAAAMENSSCYCPEIPFRKPQCRASV